MDHLLPPSFEDSPLSGEFVAIDLETTGLNPQDARIVELAFQLYGRTFPGQPERERCLRVNPGIPIPASATHVHRITDADVADKPTFKQIAENLAGLDERSGWKLPAHRAGDGRERHRDRVGAGEHHHP